MASEDSAQVPEEDGNKGGEFRFSASRAEWVSGAASERRRTYSTGELEAHRFVDVEWQRRWWKEIYEGLDPIIAREYDGLCGNGERKHHHQQRPGKKKEAEARVLGEVIAEENMMGPNLLYFPDIFCDDNFIGNSNCMIAEELCDKEEYEDESSSDEYESIQRPAFLVEGEPDFESGPPLDGMEYLRRVRWEAAQIPKVKVAKVNLSKGGSEQTPYMPNIPEIPKCPANLLPSKQWEDSFIADFAEIREAFAQMENSLDQHSAATGDVNPCKQSNSTHWPKSTPTLTSILGMDAVSRASALQNYIKLFETATTLLKEQCLWLFSLCVAVDTPLLADTSASLRCLLRKCSTLLAGKSEADDEVAMLNMLVAISGKYFGQSEK